MAYLIAVGGFAGAGKSTVARRLAQEFSLPWLSSDAIGRAITGSMGDRVPRSEAFRAGFDVLFALAEQFVRVGRPVIVDMNLGWDFQWRWLDDIATRVPDSTCVPVILRCSTQICAERMEHRHRQDPVNWPPAAQILAIPHTGDVSNYLQALDRPDACFVDADQDADGVYADVRRHLAQALGEMPTVRSAIRRGRTGRGS